MPTGVNGQPVFLAENKGLCAGLSELTEPDSPPDFSKILTYETVVEFFYNNRTVIPMRYGCQVENPSDAVRLLEKRVNDYGALLRKLEGLAEMGIQILSDDSNAKDQTNLAKVMPESFLLDSSGGNYLAMKRRYYLRIDGGELRQSKLVETLCNSLSSLFIEHKAELHSLPKGRLQSLYFLVPRSSVKSFRQAVRDFFKKQTAKQLLSGPWPPYNFVEIPQKNRWVS